jgi:hypothetical protein
MAFAHSDVRVCCHGMVRTVMERGEHYGAQSSNNP